MQCQGRGIDSKILILKLGGIGGGGGNARGKYTTKIVRMACMEGED